MQVWFPTHLRFRRVQVASFNSKDYKTLWKPRKSVAGQEYELGTYLGRVVRTLTGYMINVAAEFTRPSTARRLTHRKDDDSYRRQARRASSRQLRLRTTNGCRRLRRHIYRIICTMLVRSCLRAAPHEVAVTSAGVRHRDSDQGSEQWPRDRERAFSGIA